MGLIANLIVRCKDEISDRSRELDKGKYSSGRALTSNDRRRILREMRRIRATLRKLQETK